MSQKRQQQQEEGTSSGSADDKRPRKSPSFSSVVMEVMKLQKLQNIVEPLEPLIRRVVKEEVESALKNYFNTLKRNCAKEICSSESRNLRLRFLSAISLPVFTGTRIEGQEGSNLKLALVDDLTGEVISSGPESSSKVEIVALEGDFDTDEGQNWKLEEFTSNMVRERHGKKPLLTGDLIVTLESGEGTIGDISFTDNSSWTRSRKFRLGARVADSFDGIRIKEAMSESFVVRDHRGELYKKHHPPLLCDEVWRLEKIGKDGAFHKRLSKERVNTVRDFLILLSVDPTRLRNILGTGMSAKMWGVTVEHARTCVIDKRLFVYNVAGSQQRDAVVFNIVGQVIGRFSGCQYITADKLTDSEKAEACQLVICAFRDWQKVLTLDEACLTDASLISPSAVQTPSSNPPDISQLIHSPGGLSNFDDYLQNLEFMDIRFDQPLSFQGSVSSNNLICDTNTMTQAFADANFPYFESDSPLHSSILEPSGELPTGSDGFASCSAIPIVKARTRWTMLFSVLKWCFVIRRIVARKAPVREIPRYCYEDVQK